VTCPRLVVVNDASCLIDLRKARLLHVLTRLPHHLVVPFPIRHSELLDFTAQEWRVLDDGGMETFDLPAELVGRALAVRARHPRLSANDAFALATAEARDQSVLLTGDALLRRVAADRGARVHGVLWVITELHVVRVCDVEQLREALSIWSADRSVFLPDRLIQETRRRLR
jgi:predicted nucleic acid-binding protein